MSRRVVLRGKCSKGIHTPARVLADATGLVVEVDELVLTGYGSRSRLDRETYPLDDGEAAWLTHVGCRCGHQYIVDSLSLSRALAKGEKILVLRRAEG